MLSCVMNEGLSVVTTGSVPCFGGLSYPVAARKACRHSKFMLFLGWWASWRAGFVLVALYDFYEGLIVF
jgi:hypothetical protein